MPIVGARRAAIAAAVLSLVAVRTEAVIFTVGPDGDHATIQAAVDAVRRAGAGFHEIRVQEGVYRERVDLRLTDGRLLMRGGYNGGFVVRSLAPEATTIDADHLGRPLRVICDGAGITVEGFAITGGRIVESHGVAGGISALTGHDCQLVLRRLSVHDNRVDSPQVAQGGGIGAQTRQRSSLTLDDVQIVDNHVTAKDTAPGAAGLSVTIFEESEVEVFDSEVRGNTNTALRVGGAGGVHLNVVHSGRVTIRDSSISSNVATSVELGPTEGVDITSGDRSTARIQLQRVRIEDNLAIFQAQLRAHNMTDVRVSDSLIAGGSNDGALGYTFDSARIFLTNVTVADNAGTGVRFNPFGGKVTVANSIVFDNGDDAIPAHPRVSVEPENLIGVDPGFVEAAAGDYHLLPGSRAINSGDDLPESGLGPLDFDLEDRRQGGKVDIGADEAPDSGTGSTLCGIAGIGTAPLLFPDFTPACRCLRDAGLRVLRCSFLLPELSASARFAAPFVPGEATDADWTIYTWRPADGPFEAIPEILADGQWVPFGKPFSGQLAQGQLATWKTGFLAPAASTPLRLRIRHLAQGLQEPVEDTVLVLLEVVGPNDQP